MLQNKECFLCKVTNYKDIFFPDNFGFLKEIEISGNIYCENNIDQHFWEILEVRDRRSKFET